MENLCSLLIHVSFLGRTYHDLQLEFQSSTENCTEQNPLLIQFIRIYNATTNLTSYALYDPTKTDMPLPRLQIFDNDHVDLCIQSVLNRHSNEMICHQFYIITMLSSDRNYSPLLIIFGYIFVLLIAILFSLLSNVFRQLTKTIFSGSITKKLIQNRNIHVFLPIIANRQQQQKKFNEKKEILNTIKQIAEQCQTERAINPFIILSETSTGQTNQAYIH